jgi:hypothetical protein
MQNRRPTNPVTREPFDSDFVNTLQLNTQPYDTSESDDETINSPVSSEAFNNPVAQRLPSRLFTNALGEYGVTPEEADRILETLMSINNLVLTPGSSGVSMGTPMESPMEYQRRRSSPQSRNMAERVQGLNARAPEALNNPVAQIPRTSRLFTNALGEYGVTPEEADIILETLMSNNLVLTPGSSGVSMGTPMDESMEYQRRRSSPQSQYMAERAQAALYETLYSPDVSMEPDTSEQTTTLIERRRY